MVKATLRNCRGENHPKVKCTDHEVELIRQLHDGGMGYKRISYKFEIPIRTIRDYCSYRTR